MHRLFFIESGLLYDSLYESTKEKLQNFLVYYWFKLKVQSANITEPINQLVNYYKFTNVKTRQQ